MKNSDVLIVEDDVAIARLIEIHLKHNKLSSMTIYHGDQAIEALEQNQYRLVILDRMLPGKRGMDILRWIRRQKAIATIPVLMVTALGDTSERVRGIEEGADDYLAKPFEPEEMIARVKSLLRRAQFMPGELVPAAQLQVDEDAMVARIGAKELPLRPLEFRLLQTLIQRKGKVCSRDFLLNNVWGLDSEVEIRTVDVTVKRLRKVLSEQGLAESIKTIRGSGYRFIEQQTL